MNWTTIKAHLPNLVEKYMKEANIAFMKHLGGALAPTCLLNAEIVRNIVNTCGIWLLGCFLKSNIYTFSDFLVHTCCNNARNFHA